MINTDNLVLREKISTYESTRQRITRFYNNTRMSDKEIIEELAEEIEEYRNKIKKLTEHQRIVSGLDEIESIIINNNIKNIETRTVYALERPIETIIKYKS